MLLHRAGLTASAGLSCYVKGTGEKSESDSSISEPQTDVAEEK